MVQRGFRLLAKQRWNTRACRPPVQLAPFFLTGPVLEAAAWGCLIRRKSYQRNADVQKSERGDAGDESTADVWPSVSRSRKALFQVRPKWHFPRAHAYFAYAYRAGGEPARRAVLRGGGTRSARTQVRPRYALQPPCFASPVLPRCFLFAPAISALLLAFLPSTHFPAPSQLDAARWIALLLFTHGVVGI